MRLRSRSRRRTAAATLLFGGFVALALLPGQNPREAGAQADATTPVTETAMLASAPPIPTVKPAAPAPAEVAAAAPATAAMERPAQPRPAPAGEVLASTGNIVDLPSPAPSPALTATPPPAPQPDEASATDAGDGVAGTTTDSVRSARIGDLAVNVRAGPSKGAQKLFVAQPGQSVEIREMQGGWVHIVTADGASGWVYSRYIAGGMG